MSLFTAAHTAAMRDPTKRRNYSEEAEQFRREHAARRAWGLEQRHARKLRRLYGSTTAAWAAYRQRAEEVLSPVCPAPTDGEAGPPARAGSDIVTETPPASPIPAMPETALPVPALPETALPVPALPETALPAPALPDTVLPTPAKPKTALPGITLSETALPAAARPGTISPETSLPAAARPKTARPVVTTSSQVEYIPVVCDASASEVLTPEAILAGTATAEPSRDHRDRTNPVPGRPTPTTQAAQIGSEPTTAEPSAAKPSAAKPSAAKPSAAKPSTAKPSAAKPLSARRATGALTTSCIRRRDHPARRSPTRTVSRRPAGEKTPASPSRQSSADRARRRGQGRRKQTRRPASTCRIRPATNTQESARKQSIAPNILTVRGDTFDVEHYCGNEPWNGSQNGISGSGSH
jgi:hypothetical protein